MVEEARDVAEDGEDVRGDVAEVVRLAHHEVEDGVDGGAAVGLRVELPARVRGVEEEAGAQVGEEGAAVGPVVAFTGREGFDERKSLLKEPDVAPVGGGVVRPEAAAVGVESGFGGILREDFPRGAEKFVGGGVEFPGAAARGWTKDGHGGVADRRSVARGAAATINPF